MINQILNTFKVKLLIRKGASVNKRDRSGLSALSYACILTFTDIAIELIANGCVCTWSMSLNEYSPLEYLMYKQQYKIVKYIIESGFCIWKEKWLTNNTYQSKNINQESLNWIKSYMNKPRSLMSISRQEIRKHLGDVCIYDKIAKLNVSNHLKDYLKMKF
jgi:ankyrin repeat protein